MSLSCVLLVDQRLLDRPRAGSTVLCSSGRLSASRSAMVPAASLMSATEEAMGSAAVVQLGDQRLEVLHRLVELLLVLDRGVEHGVEVLDHLADRLIAVGQRRRQ